MKVYHIHFNLFDHLINIFKISVMHLLGVYDELTINPLPDHTLHKKGAEPRFGLHISDSKAYVYSFLSVFNFCDIGLSFKKNAPGISSSGNFFPQELGETGNVVAEKKKGPRRK